MDTDVNMMTRQVDQEREEVEPDVVDWARNLEDNIDEITKRVNGRFKMSYRMLVWEFDRDQMNSLESALRKNRVDDRKKTKSYKKAKQYTVQRPPDVQTGMQKPVLSQDQNRSQCLSEGSESWPLSSSKYGCELPSKIPSMSLNMDI